MSVLANFLEDHFEFLVSGSSCSAVSGDSGDFLSDLLRELMSALRSARIPAQIEGARGQARWHFQQGLPLEAMVRQYGALREELFNLLDDTPGVELKSIRLLNGFLDLAAAQGVAEYERLRAGESGDAAGTWAEIQRLRTLIARAPVGITFLRGPNFVVETANAQMCRSWGRTPEQMIGKPMFDVLSEARNQGFEELLSGVLRTGTPFVANDLPATLARLDGGGVEVAHFSVIFAPVRDSRGEIEGIVATASEVTEIVRARQREAQLTAALQEREMGREGLLRALSAQSFLRVATLKGPQLIFETANETYLNEVAGGRPILGKPLFEVLPELVGQEAEKIVQQVWATGEPFVSHRLRVLLKDPAGVLRERFLNSVYQPVREADGSFDTLLVLGHDVTDVVRAQQSVQASEDRLLRMMRHAPAAICLLTGTEHRLVLTNPRFLELVGGRGDLGRSVAEALPEVVDQGFVRLLDDVRRSGNAHIGTETWLHLRRGPLGAEQEVCLNFICQPIPDSDGQVESIFFHAVEVTEMVLARETAQTLERTAEERSKFERQLIGIVSHDLRNPLNAITIGAAALARREGLEEGIVRNVLRIQASADRAVRLVKDLLDFTQLRLGGGIRLQPNEVDLHRAAQQWMEELQASFPGREIVLESRGSASGIWDADRIAQVVVNLVTNAVKYSTEGSRVDLRIRGETDAVILEVHNWGEPIPQEARSRLFQPMERSTARPDRTGRSVGLGLYIVKQLVEAHRGTVGVHSAEAEGTTFSVRLPR